MKIGEDLLYQIWQRQLIKKDSLVTADGRHIAVINPGQYCDDCGPDFRDAEIRQPDGSILSGDVEIEVYPGGWYQHHHHLDARYDHVILNVVMSGARHPFVLTRGRTRVPVLALADCLTQPIDEILAGFGTGKPPGESCQLKSRGPASDKRNEILALLGRRRFLLKVERFTGDIRSRGEPEALYRGIMRGLGYSRNIQPFEKLASGVPPALIKREIKKAAPAYRLTAIQALLFGSAGLLPSQRPGLERCKNAAYVKELESAWRSIGLMPCVNGAEWRFFKVRPVNYPTRRLAAFSYLLNNERDLFLTLLGSIKMPAPGEVIGSLTRNLVVRAGGYWADHFDFQQPDTRKSGVLLGSQRAVGIVLDVILPFYYAWCTISRRMALASRLERLYNDYQGLAQNKITRKTIRTIDGNKGWPDSLPAYQHQGLMMLYAEYCQQGKCRQCPLLVNA